MKLHSIFKITAFAAVALAMSACSDELAVQDSVPDSGDSFWSQYDFVISDGIDTRVAYTDLEHAEFEEGDEVGVYVVDTDSNLVSGQPTNASYTVRNVTNLNTGEQRQVLQPTNPDVAVDKNSGYRYVLYYPRNPNMTLDRLKNYTHAIELEQGSKEAYESSDLLWCYYTPPSSDTYEVAFDHVMAQLVIELGSGEVFLSDDTNTPSGVYFLNMPTRGFNINLVQEWSDGFSYGTETVTPPTDGGEENPAIHAWQYGTAASGNLQFRALVPAHTVAADVPAVRIYTANGTYTDYKLGGKVQLKAGYNYTLSLNGGGKNVPLTSDDDSWVLDVLDPVTGEPVGLLCREYIRYQPQMADNELTTPDEPTGTEVVPLGGGDTKKAVNSQAWVFYNLQSDGTTPELGRGTVLRFIYDVRVNSNEVMDAAHFWPLPHTQPGNEVHQGLFTPEHGFKWIQSKTTASDGNYYGVSSSEVDESLLADDEKEVNYYMHGGTIVWDADNGKISDFIPPTAQTVTNDMAKAYGHIAIDPETGSASVSYSGLDDASSHYDIDGNKVGLIVPRNLIDTRINADGVQETAVYPLVKIGFNQFWISKPFRATTLTDGTSLTCYNAKGDPDGATVGDRKPAKAIFTGGDDLGGGYMYPFATDVTTQDGTTTNYDPYNDASEMAGPQGTEWDGRTSTFRPAPIYNKAAVEDSRFVPAARSGEYEYIMPTADEFESMIGYFGYGFAAKLCTREIARYTGVSSAYGNDRYTALMRGETYDGAAGFFTANISGFNLRAIGYYHHQATDGNSLGRSAALILKSQSSAAPNSVAYISFEPYDPWKTDPNVGFFVKEGFYYGNYYTNYFAQVRLMMRFKHPTSGSSSVRAATRAGAKAGRGRNVTLQLVP